MRVERGYNYFALRGGILYVEKGYSYFGLRGGILYVKRGAGWQLQIWLWLKGGNIYSQNHTARIMTSWAIKARRRVATELLG